MTIMGIIWVGVLSADVYTKGHYRTVSECELILLEVATKLILIMEPYVAVSITLLFVFQLLSALCVPILCV